MLRNYSYLRFFFFLRGVVSSSVADAAGVAGDWFSSRAFSTPIVGDGVVVAGVGSESSVVGFDFDSLPLSSSLRTLLVLLLLLVLLDLLFFFFWNKVILGTGPLKDMRIIEHSANTFIPRIPQTLSAASC